MPKFVIVVFEVVNIHHHNPQRILAAGGGMQFAHQGFIQVAPVIQTGERIVNGLHAQCFAQAQICQRHGSVFRQGHGQQFQLRHRLTALSLQVINTQRLTLCIHGNT
jgi:hypothetical protein